MFNVGHQIDFVMYRLSRNRSFIPNRNREGEAAFLG